MKKKKCSSLPGLGARIKAARKRLRMSQRQLASALGVNLSTVGRWETDYIGISLPMFVLLCDKLNADPAELLDMKPQGTKEPPLETINAIVDKFRNELIETCRTHCPFAK